MYLMLNIGLMCNTNDGMRNSMARTARTVRFHGFRILASTYHPESAKCEPTMAYLVETSYDWNDRVSIAEYLRRVSLDLQQDCILAVPCGLVDLGTAKLRDGDLFGDGRHKWLPFNSEYFQQVDTSDMLHSEIPTMCDTSPESVNA